MENRGGEGAETGKDRCLSYFFVLCNTEKKTKNLTEMTEKIQNKKYTVLVRIHGRRNRK